jgi:hypothetical protein
VKSLYQVIEYTICNPVQQVLAAAKNGFVADGVELNPWLVAYSKLQAFRLGLGRCTRFYCRDLWKVQLQPYQNVVVFGVQEMVSTGSVHHSCMCGIYSFRFLCTSRTDKSRLCCAKLQGG